MCSTAVPPQLRPHLSLLSSSTVAQPLPLIPFQPSRRTVSTQRSRHSLGPFLSLSPSFPFSHRLPFAYPSILGSIRLPTHPYTLLGGLADWLAVRLTACPTANPPRFFLFSSASLPYSFALLSWSLRLFYTPPFPLRSPLPQISTPFSFSFCLSLAPSLMPVARAPDIIRFEIKLPRHARHPNNASGCLKQ